MRRIYEKRDGKTKNCVQEERRAREKRRVVTVRKGNDKELADENEGGR